jgi:hypothetical protein
MGVPDVVPIFKPLHGVDATGTITGTFPCRKCSYELRGLNEDGRCPECGTPVAVSLNDDFLRFSQPEWLDNLQSGARLILWSVLVSIAGGIFAVIFSQLIWHKQLQFAIAAPVLIALLMSLVGSWRLTTPDPSGLGESRYGTSRQLIRWGLAASALKEALNLSPFRTLLPSVDVQIIEGFLIALQLFNCIALVAEMLYLSKLADRLPDDRLSERAMFLMYAFGCTERESLAGPGNQFFICRDEPLAHDAWDIDPPALETEKACGAAHASAIVESGGLRAAVRFERKLSEKSTARQTVLLSANSRRLEFHTAIDWHEDHKLLKVAFPVAMRAMNATYEMQFGRVEGPTHFKHRLRPGPVRSARA